MGAEQDDGLGRGAEVPATIAALGSRKKAERERAFVELTDERLVHQGQHWPAAPLAVPLLAEALAQPKHPGKALVLSTLAHVAVGTPALYARRQRGLPTLSARAAGVGVEGDAFRAVRALAPTFARCLDERAAGTRAHAAAALVLVDPVCAAVELAVRVSRERDASVWIAYVLALGLAPSLALPAAVPPAALPALPDDASDAMRTAHAIAATHAGVLPDEAARTAIAKGLDEPLARIETPLGHLGDLALGAALAIGAEGRALLTTALDGASPERKPLVAEALVRAVFADAGHVTSVPALVSSRAVPADALEIVRIVAQAAPANLWGPLDLLASVGFTRWGADLRRFVGIDPPGPLERMIACPPSLRERAGAHDGGLGEIEVVIVLDALARGALDESEARAALEPACDPAALVDLARYAADNRYQLHDRRAWGPEAAIAFASSLLHESACLPRIRELLAAGALQLSWGCWALLDALVRIAPGDPGVDLADALRFVAPRSRGSLVTIVRAAAAASPPALRDALALEVDLPDVIERAPKIGGRPVEPRFGAWNLLDLAADRHAAARRGATAVARWTGEHASWQVHPRDAAERALVALRPESQRELEAVLAGATAYGRAILQPLVVVR